MGLRELADKAAGSAHESSGKPVCEVKVITHLRVHATQSEEFYTALRRLGKHAVMIRYPEEFHALRRPIHRIDRYERTLAWFEYHRRV